MKTLLRDPDKFYKPKARPSGHQIGKGFGRDNGGAIPSNLLQIPNTESNGSYLRLCKRFKVEPHPARFPIGLPEFFIKFLTEEGDTVADIFGGSGTTAEAAERNGRKWITIDSEREYVRGSLFRFVIGRPDDSVQELLELVDGGSTPLVTPPQPSLFDPEEEQTEEKDSA
jgi:DNA modification methylase